MAKDDRPDGFSDFDDRLRRLRGDGRQPEKGGESGPRERLAGHGPALQAGIEIIGGVVGGALIGFALDRWLETGPWLLILFFVLGAAGGLRNAYRRLSRLGGGPGAG